MMSKFRCKKVAQGQPCRFHNQYASGAYLCFCPECKQEARGYKVWPANEWDEHSKAQGGIADRQYMNVSTDFISCNFSGGVHLTHDLSVMLEQVDELEEAAKLWAQAYDIENTHLAEQNGDGTSQSYLIAHACQLLHLTRMVLGQFSASLMPPNDAIEAYKERHP